MKEFKVEIPEGYEIDKEKSTFEKIVFKKKEEVVNCWEDIKQTIKGAWITPCSEIQSYNGNAPCEANKNVFFNEKYAKSALAFAQISQLLPYYDSNVNWYIPKPIYCIYRYDDCVFVEESRDYNPIAFNTREEAERFLEHNEKLVNDFYMLD
jgi:hypothetical protein